MSYRPTAPQTTVSESGSLQYNEVRRKESNMKEYVNVMKLGSTLTREKNDQNELIRKLAADAAVDPKVRKQLESIINSVNNSSSQRPFLTIKKRNADDPSLLEFDQKTTDVYFEALASIAKDGITFQGRHALITGCGKDSIGVEILKALLSGGASVIVTTSSFSKKVTEYYRSIYEKHGSKGSSLIVVPFNGGSAQDIEALVNYIYDGMDKNGLGWDLDFVIPFAAISEVGREIDQIDSRSELAHRIMLTNVLRLLGCIKVKKEVLRFNTRPANILLPLSPNHGTFGGDGLYGESKIGLETLMNRFHSENWSQYLTIIGGVIGWTRGTGLMSGNNMVAEGVEKVGARTFSTHEMAFNLIGLLHPKIIAESILEPIWADLNGGLQYIKDLKKLTASLREELTQLAEIRSSISKENAKDQIVMKGESREQIQKITPRANLKFDFPKVSKNAESSNLLGMLDLDQVVVATGFGEVGPFGGSRTRWEMEAYGEFSLEGCIEMAWIMNLISFHHGPLKKMPFYSGWIDVESQEPVQDLEIKYKYESKILDHTGIRLIGKCN